MFDLFKLYLIESLEACSTLPLLQLNDNIFACGLVQILETGFSDATIDSSGLNRLVVVFGNDVIGQLHDIVVIMRH